VTDAMPQSRSSDWLMARQTIRMELQPAADITRANVKDLKLAWVWQMKKRAPTSRCTRAQRHHVSGEHANTVQAWTQRPALIWENIGPSRSSASARCELAIYNDKIITATTARDSSRSTPHGQAGVRRR
jgi:hypothetical protein